MKQTNKNVPIVVGKVRPHRPGFRLSDASLRKQRKVLKRLAKDENLSGGERVDIAKQIEADNKARHAQVCEWLKENQTYLETVIGADGTETKVERKINISVVDMPMPERKLHTPEDELPVISYKEPTGKPSRVTVLRPDSAGGKGARRFAGSTVDPVFYTDKGRFYGKHTTLKAEPSEYDDSFERPDSKAPRVSHTVDMMRGNEQHGLPMNRQGFLMMDGIRRRHNEVQLDKRPTGYLSVGGYSLNELELRIRNVRFFLLTMALAA